MRLRSLLTRTLIAGALACAAGSAWAMDKVVLQLNWRHQFQFAGYYQAVEQGFYREAGLDVEIREGGPGSSAPALLEQGKADFAVCTSSVLARKPDRPKLVALAMIFQHSAAVIVILSRSQISSLAELKGRRLMDIPGSATIAAMLKHEGVDYASLPRVQHDGDPRDLVAGKADAMVTYITDDLFELDQLHVPYQTYSPRMFGVDFYGDGLCTAAKRASDYPEQTRAFRAASIEGWKYALAHKDETVELILSRYFTRRSREALKFEASRVEGLVQPQLIDVGTQTRERWQRIANVYHDLGLIQDRQVPAHFTYDPGGGRPRWFWSALVLLLGFSAVAAVAVLLYRGSHRGTGRAWPKPRFGHLMSFLFVGLSVPILIFILIYSYQRNSETILATLQKSVEKTSELSVDRLDGMVRRVASVLRMLADKAATQPDYFRTEESRSTLYLALTSAREIDAASISFEDGYHRVVTRVDADRRRSDAQIPASANWHSSYIDPLSLEETRSSHRKFFDTWGHQVGEYDTPTRLDIHTLLGYAEARDSASPVVTEPTINPDTGFPIISVRVPIDRGGDFLGCASADLTFDVLSRFLAADRVSPRSRTIIADLMDGIIVASSEKGESAKHVDGKLEVVRLADTSDSELREAYRLHTATNQDTFVFTSPRDGEELTVSFARFPSSFGHPWEAIIITPTADFVGPLQKTNQQIIIVIVVLTLLELLLMFVLSRRLSHPIEAVTKDLESVESLSLSPPIGRPSSIREVARLQTSVSLLRNSLLSFSRFAPVDVVRSLIKSRIPLALGVERRFVTVFFCDLENFSTHAERLSADDLLRQMSVYFDCVSKAISDEEGTVDKFIGDGIMAFWGAPQEQPDQVLRACRGAVRAMRRMDKANEAWRAEGKPTFRLRIGLHCGEALVGNVGSTERFSYTVMGDVVNVAARLEGLNKQFGTAICISDSIYDAAHSQILARPLGNVQVKGREQEFLVYELVGIARTDEPELQEKY
jgi:class 3 adenylate cyclase/ABC-type nitrate/sulfonate/bicarbonate transport system substrate-binding protein